jgi:hypothetical protein
MVVANPFPQHFVVPSSQLLPKDDTSWWSRGVTLVCSSSTTVGITTMTDWRLDNLYLAKGEKSSGPGKSKHNVFWKAINYHDVYPVKHPIILLPRQTSIYK